MVTVLVYSHFYSFLINFNKKLRGPGLVGEAATHARTIFRGKKFEFKLFLELKILSK